MLVIILSVLTGFFADSKQTTDWAQEWANASQMSSEQLVQAIQSPKWHVRSSALLQLEKLDQKKALEVARVLIKDPALLVRSQAVRVLSKSSLEEDRAILIDQLYRPENFHKGQSLFIRREILKALPFDKIMSQAQLVTKLQQDNDIRIRDYTNAKLGQRRVK